MLPIVCIVGAKNSGKTTLVEALVRELTARGRRVATAKHAHEGFQLDHEGKDSWRHMQAGAVGVALRGPEEFAILAKGSNVNLFKLASFLTEDADLIIAEGFGEEAAFPKIEIMRQEISETTKYPLAQLLALVTDVPGEWPLPTFGLHDIAPIADLIEAKLFKFRREVRLIVDGAQIPLNRFTDSFIARTIRGMLSALRGVSEEAEKIDVHIRKKQ